VTVVCDQIKQRKRHHNRECRKGIIEQSTLIPSNNNVISEIFYCFYLKAMLN
jgi:hypothetical protein